MAMEKWDQGVALLSIPFDNSCHWSHCFTYPPKYIITVSQDCRGGTETGTQTVRKQPNCMINELNNHTEGGGKKK